jgi:ABC-2 type transport system permease protein
VAGIIVLFINYFSAAFIGIKTIAKFLPYKLVEAAGQFRYINLTTTLVTVVIISIIFILLSIRRMNRVEVV